MNNKTLILYKSVHHGNTKKIADEMARVLNAEVINPDDAMCPTAGGHRLIGIGSGIYYGRFHPAIRNWVKRIRRGAGQGIDIFIFSTSGLPFLSPVYHLPLRRSLQAKGFRVVGEFSCRGRDTFTLLKLFGGLNRKHPDDEDLRGAREFARRL